MKSFFGKHFTYHNNIVSTIAILVNTIICFLWQTSIVYTSYLVEDSREGKSEIVAQFLHARQTFVSYYLIFFLAVIAIMGLQLLIRNVTFKKYWLNILLFFLFPSCIMVLEWLPLKKYLPMGPFVLLHYTTGSIWVRNLIVITIVAYVVTEIIRKAFFNI